MKVSFSIFLTGRFEIIFPNLFTNISATRFRTRIDGKIATFHYKILVLLSSNTARNQNNNNHHLLVHVRARVRLAVASLGPRGDMSAQELQEEEVEVLK